MQTILNIIQQFRSITPKLYRANKKLQTSLSVGGNMIVLDSIPGVWPPYTTGQMMAKEIMPRYIENIQDSIVIDVGTGSGLFAIAASKLGAKVTIATDLNDNALKLTKHNWNINKCDGLLKTVISDGLDSISSNYKGEINFMISNPPVQPFLLTKKETKRLDEYEWNEAGNSGRSVLDSILMKGTTFLADKGKLITATSSRHGWNRTVEILDTLVRNKKINNWKVIHSEEHELAPFYTKYIDTWLTLDKNDSETRIWRKNGKWHHRFLVLEITK